jgi:DNA-binding LacI/PurR family transcriptional regulator
LGVTIRDVADALGVSTSTISRTLNGQGRISPATRSMILERMKDMGYTPNVNAQRLVSGRAYMVALDFGANQHLLADMYFAELTRGIQNALQSFGYSLLLNATGDRLQHLVKSRAVDGVILFGGEPEDIEKLQGLAVEGTPSVLISHCAYEPALNFAPVFTDLPHGAREVADYLLSQGHRRIAFIGSYESDLVLETFRERLQEHSIPLIGDYLAFAGPDPEQAEKHMAGLLALSAPPTAVFARTDALAAGALRAAYRAGIRVPDAISIVGHDDVPFARLTSPALTTVRIDGAQMGKLATEAMCLMLDNPGVAMQPRIIRPQLVLRETVAPPVKK